MDSGAAVLLGAAAIVLSLLGYTLWSGYQTSHREALTTVRNLAATLASNFEGVLDHAESDIRIVVREIVPSDLSGDIAPTRRDRLEDQMANNLRAFPAIYSYRIFDAAGQGRFGAGPGNQHALLNVSDREWFRQLRDTPGSDLAISDVVISKTVGQQAVIMGVALRDTAGRFLGAIDASINLGYFQDRIEKLDVGSGGTVVVRRTDNFHLILRRPRAQAYLNEASKGGMSALLDAAERNGARSGDGDYRASVDNIERTYAYQFLDRFPFAVLVAISPRDYLRPWWRQVALGAAGTVLLAGALSLLYRRHRQAQGRLMDAAIRHRAVMQTAGDGLHILDRNGTLLEASDAFFRMLGYPPDGPPRLSVTDWDRNPSADESMSILREAANGANRVFETKYLRTDGSEIDVEISTSQLLLGKRRLIYASSRDITERKRTEAALHAREAQLQLFIEHAPVALAMFDREMHYIAATRRWTDDYLMGDRDIGGRLYYEVFADIPEAWKEAHRRAMAGERLHADADRFERSDGSVQWLRWEVLPWHDRDGSVGGIVIFSEDITARTEAEAERRSTLARLDLVLKTTAEGIIGLDAERRVMFATPAAATILGRPSTEAMLGKTSHEVFGHLLADGSACGATTCRIRHDIETGEIIRIMDEFFTRQDGTVIPVEYVVSPLTESGVNVGAVIAFHDIIERKALEDKLRRSSAELLRFAEVSAHHLQEPAARMARYSDRLTAQLAGRFDDAETRLSLDYLGRQARRQCRLLRDVQRYLAADQPRGEIGIIDAKTVVASIMDTMAPRLAEAGAEVSVGDPPPACLDLPRLTDMFEVALDNALAHAAGSRPLRISIDGERRGDRVRYSVSDNGPGIPEEYRERVFRVFERLTAAGEGTGIGLAIVRRVAESTGGSAWIAESPAGGCRLIFDLPVGIPP